jgi:hypothetical protein
VRISREGSKSQWRFKGREEEDKRRKKKKSRGDKRREQTEGCEVQSYDKRGTFYATHHLQLDLLDPFDESRHGRLLLLLTVSVYVTPALPGTSSALQWYRREISLPIELVCVRMALCR